MLPVCVFVDVRSQEAVAAGSRGY